jgi:hypothetical protein
MRERIFAVFDQQPIEIRIDADHRHVFDVPGKCDLIHVSPEYDIAPQKRA